MKIGWWATLSCLLCGCGTTLFSGAVKTEHDAWTVALTELRDGPNIYQQTNVIYVPQGGRLLWLRLLVRNGGASTRRFDYGRCNVDLGPSAIAPSLITYSAVMSHTTMSAEASFGPGEEKKRYLAFVYPRKQLPTRVACADMFLTLPVASH